MVRKGVILLFSIVIFVILAGLAFATNCWLYEGNQTACTNQTDCAWRPTATNPWCTNNTGCCEGLNCWSFNGNKTGCDYSQNSLGMSCSWVSNDKNQEPWCPIKKIGDWSPSGMVTSTINVGCCEMTGCWDRDGTNESYCEDSAFLNGICDWQSKAADPSCPDSVGCCDVASCSYFGDDQTKCNAAADYNVPCQWTGSACTEGGCEQHHNKSADCLSNGCNYNSSSGSCVPPSTDFVGEGGGADHCWFADNNPATCMNMTGCIYCTNDSTIINMQAGGGNISYNQSFCYREPVGYCNGHQSNANQNATGASGNVEYLNNMTYFRVNISTATLTCSDIRLKQACDCGPFPSCKWTNSSTMIGSFCTKLNRTKTTEEESVCKPNVGGEEVKFCEDPKIINEVNCTWLTTSFNMPCKWESANNKCKFSYESVFKTGPIGDLWEIDVSKGGETACLAAKGVWNCEQYEEGGQIKNDCFCKDGVMKTGSMVENCNSNCGACEWFFSNGSSVNTSAKAKEACLNSSLGYCQWTNNSNDALNGFGFCSPPSSFKFGGGDCKTDCKSCGIVSTNVTMQQQSCQNSPIGCSWVNNTMGGYCQASSKGSCSNDCMACPSQQDCQASALSCVWESTYSYCKPQGFSGEICFDTMDNDGDGNTDCSDSGCVFNEFCGGDVFGNCGKYHDITNCSSATVMMGSQAVNCSWILDIWTNAYLCSNPGEMCWVYDDNQTGCNATAGCGWINLTSSNGAWCDINTSIGKTCHNFMGSPANCNLDSNCIWVNITGPAGEGGYCDFRMFRTCDNLTTSNACTANANCTWSMDSFGMGSGSGTSGHCEPACFNESLDSTTCTQNKPFCEWRSTICEPSFMTSDCAVYDGNQTGCEAQPMCQWYSSNNLCDPKAGSQMFAGGGFMMGGLMPGDNAGFQSMEFFHLGDDSQYDWVYPSGWTGTLAYNDSLEALDIAYFGIKDMGDQYGFGVGVTQTKTAAMCNGKPTHWPDAAADNTGTNTTKFYWYLDTNNNATGGCNATAANGSSVVGFEFLISYLESWSTTQNKSVDSKTVYRCSNNSWIPTSVSLYVDRVIACQFVGGAGVAIEKESLEGYPQLYNSTAVMRVFVATGHNTTFIVDSAEPGYLTHGTIDFKPECCFCPGDVDMDGDGKTASTDEECTFIKQKGFMSFEDCFNGKDDNNDGLTDCNDPICSQMPKCGGTFAFASNINDKKSPNVIFQTEDTWPDGAFIKFDTDEPAKGAVEFYSNSSGCVKRNATLLDLGDPSFTFDDYKPFHGVMLGQDTLNYSLSLSTVYYYKTRVTDFSNNTALSACLNFTTRSEFKKVLFDVDLDSGYTADFVCANYSKTDWNGTYAIKINTSMTKNCNLTIKCSNGTYEMGLVGVDIGKPLDIDLQSKLVCNTTDKMIGMDSDNEAWSETLFAMGMGGASDYILEEYPLAYSAGNSLKQCDEDTATGCVDITSYANCSGNSTSTICKIPTSVGYSGHLISVPSGGDSGGSSGGGGTSSVGTGDVAISGVSESEAWQTLVYNARVIFSLTKAEIPIQKVTFNMNLLKGQARYDVSMTVYKLKTKPTTLPDVGNVYSYLSIKKVNLNDKDVKDIKIGFKIPKTWLENYNEDTVSLLRYVDDKWEVLPTTKISATPTDINYESTTPGFSYFAINASVKPIEEAKELAKETPVQEAEKAEEPQKPVELVIEQPKEKKAAGYVYVYIAVMLIAGVLIVELVRKHKKARRHY